MKNKIMTIGRLFFIIIGAFITAYGLESILIPNNVSDGGVTGISIVGSTLLNLPLGILIGILNLPFVWLGYKQIGKKFAILSIVGILSLSIFTSIMHNIPTIIEGDSLLVTVVGGVIIGFGMGLALRNGGALDGIDMLAVLLSRKLPFGTSDLILFLNSFVFILVSTVFGLKGAILSSIAYFIASKVIHIIEEGFSGSKTFKIITSNHEALIIEVQTKLGRSCTFSTITASDMKTALTEVTCLINRLEEQKLKEIINSVDPKAYIAVYETADYHVGNIKKEDVH
ncbi:YitT family protein [Staphylococcus lentus]|uniref:YitT family protein n=2 Tax=Staphylococcaceae TaxID=90964 RepID=A0ABS6GZH6_MAMLE|nr:YitT family protein [Mammaliicoccus lentus]MBF0841915.1 YitT family protein [Mammaliicoccus lentus]MBU6114865.1 YitT family protein [Mammaliicoccus lentus]